MIFWLIGKNKSGNSLILRMKLINQKICKKHKEYNMWYIAIYSISVVQEVI